MSVGATEENLREESQTQTSKSCLTLDAHDPHRRQPIFFPTPITVTTSVTFPPPRSPIVLRAQLTPSPVRCGLPRLGGAYHRCPLVVVHPPNRSPADSDFSHRFRLDQKPSTEAQSGM